MRSLALLLLTVAAAWGQQLPFNVKDPNLQETLEYLAGEAKKNKAALATINVNGYVQSVTAGTPICSSGGAFPNITFCGTIPESKVVGLVTDLGTINTSISSLNLLTYNLGISTNANAVAITGKVSKAGDTMTGPLYVSTSTAGFGFGLALEDITGDGLLTVKGVTAVGPPIVMSTAAQISALSGIGVLKLYDPNRGQSGQLTGYDASTSWVLSKMGFGTPSPTFSVDAATDVRISGTGLALSIPNGSVNVGATGAPSAGVKMQIQNGELYVSSTPYAFVVGAGRSGFLTTVPAYTVDVQGDANIGIGGTNCRWTTGGSETCTGDMTAARYFGDASNMTGIITTAGGYLTGAISIVSTNTSSHATYPLTIGNLPGPNNVALAFRSTDTTIPTINATINDGASGVRLDIHNGLTTGGSTPVGNTGGIVVNGTDGISSPVGVISSTRIVSIGFDQDAMLNGGGARFGCGAGTVVPGCGVPLVTTAGKIAALSSTYLANLDGSALTNVTGTDATRVLKTGDTMTGDLTIAGTASPFGYQSLKFSNATSTKAYPIGEMQFIQAGTGHARIIDFGDNGTYPGEFVMGTDITAGSASRGVHITGDPNQRYDIFASSWGSVGISTGTPDRGTVLDVNGYALFRTTAAISGNAFSVGGSTFVVSGGNVGIGTPNPAYLQHNVVPFAKTDATTRIVAAWSSNEAIASNPFGAYAGIIGNAVAASRTFKFQTGHFGLDNLGNLALQTDGGNVGIGTASPGHKLEVSGDAKIGEGTNTNIRMTAQAGITAIDAVNDAENSFVPLRINSSALYLNPTGGNVGIGTPNPAAKLHVSSGTLLVDGAGGNISVPGSSVTASSFFGELDGSASFKAGSFLSVGDNTGNPLNTSGYAMPAKSVDGVAQSSGCLVVLSFPDGGATSVMTETSTTTQNTRANYEGTYGVLAEASTPGVVSRVGMKGVFRVQADATGISSGFTVAMSTTRCRAAQDNADDALTVGYKLFPGAVPANGFFWMQMK